MDKNRGRVAFMCAVPEIIIVVDVYGSGFGVFVDAISEEEKVWLSVSGHNQCVPNRARADQFIEQIRQKNPDVQIVEHYYDGYGSYLPPNLNRTIL